MGGRGGNGAGDRWYRRSFQVKFPPVLTLRRYPTSIIRTPPLETLPHDDFALETQVETIRPRWASDIVAA